MENKSQILELKNKGYSAKQISATTGLSVNTIKSFLRRTSDTNITFCKNCNKEINLNNRNSRIIFCCDKCRISYWYKNHVNITQSLVCIECGQTFLASKHKKQKFCSHDCYIKHRYRKEECDE